MLCNNPRRGMEGGSNERRGKTPTKNGTVTSILVRISVGERGKGARGNGVRTQEGML